MKQKVFKARDIQTGPFAACTAPFVLINFQLFHFHTEEPILITPEGQYWEKGNLTPLEKNETVGFKCLGCSNRTICSLRSPFFSDIFVLFYFHYATALRRSRSRFS